MPVQTFTAAQPYNIPAPEQANTVVDFLQAQGVQQKNVLAGQAIDNQNYAVQQRNMLNALVRQPGFTDASGQVTPQGLNSLAVNGHVDVAQKIRDQQALAAQQAANAERYKSIARLNDQKVQDKLGEYAMDVLAQGVAAAQTTDGDQATKADRSKAAMYKSVDALEKSGAVPPAYAATIRQSIANFDPVIGETLLTTHKSALARKAEQEKGIGTYTHPIPVDDKLATFEKTPQGMQLRFLGVNPAAQNATTNATREQRLADEDASFGTLSETARNYSADLLDRTGNMPSMGQGKAGTKARKEVIETAADNALKAGRTVGDVVAGQGALKSDKASLTQLTRNYDAVEAFSNTASANGQVLKDLAHKVDSTGIPVFERWLRAGRKAIAGDVDVTNFQAQLKLYGNEIAKIATNPNLTGQLTDQAQREFADILDRGSSAKQIDGLVDLLDGDAKRRKVKLEQQMDAVVGRMRDGGKRAAPAADAAPASDAIIEWSSLKRK